MVESRQHSGTGGDIVAFKVLSGRGARGNQPTELCHYNTTKDVVQWGKIVGGGN